MERIVEFSPAWDKRDSDPKKNYGINGVEVRFVLKGPEGAVQFLLMTDWHLPHVQKEFEARPRSHYFSVKPMGADIGYHARVPQYEGQTKITECCPYLDGDPCYYDGSSLRADEFVPKFLAGGSEAVWKMLEKEYQYRFKEK